MKKKSLSLLLSLLICSTAQAALEDYTTYTEVDEQGDITITDSVTITFSTMRSDADSYVYKDFGVGHFGNFTHYVKSEFTAATGQGRVGIWAVANSLNAFVDLRDDDLNGISIVLQEAVGNTETYTITNHADGASDNSVDVGDTGIDFHVPARLGTACSDAIYSDEARTSLIDTIAVTCATTTYRYGYALLGSGNDSASTAVRSGTVEDLDLNEAVAVLSTIQEATLQGATIN